MTRRAVRRAVECRAAVGSNPTPRRGSHLARLAVVGLGALLAATLATRAEAAETPTKVALLEPDSASAVVHETVTRARAELASAGFEVVVVRTKRGEPRADLEDALREAGATAAIAIAAPAASEGRTSSIVEVWVSDRLTGKISIRPVETAGTSNAPALLALRAVELLRASLVEVDLGATNTPVPADVRHFVGADATPFGIEAGVAGVFAVDPALPAIAPELRFSWVADVGFGARVTWIGPTLGPGFEGALGEAQLTQYLAFAEALYRPPLDSPLSFTAGLGLGVYHVSARGELTDADREREDDSTALLATAAVGLGIRFHQHFGVALDLTVGVTAPRVTIAMGDEVVGRLGRPLLTLTAGPVARF
ncbi:MAG: hypothetical protein U0271_20570 [Polyangiaceae bacterium]